MELASGDGAAPIDVLHLDACSMGLLEVAYELRDYARYLVVSQNLAWSFFLQDRYRAQVDDTTEPRQLGQAIVTTYAEYAEQERTDQNNREHYPYTIALLDLARVDATVNALNALARELKAFALADRAHHDILETLRTASQKLDSQDFYRLTVFDEYVDLVDWGRLVQDSDLIDDRATKERIQAVLNAIQGDNPLIVAERTSGDRFSMPSRFGGALTDLKEAHGISIYYPHHLSPSVANSVWDMYGGDQLFQMTAGDLDNWDEFLSVVIAPSAEDGAEPGKPVVPDPLPLEPTGTPEPEPTAEPTAGPDMEPTAAPTAAPTTGPNIERPQRQQVFLPVVQH
jgi:hypothetical protein